MDAVDSDPLVHFHEEHALFRASVRRFVEQEVAPHHAAWEKEGAVSREVWRKAGEAGLLGFDVPEAYGGLGVTDFRYHQILSEELVRAGAHGPGFAVHTDIVAPYLIRYGTEEQKRRYLPGAVSGACILAIAMTEPNAGSDLAGVQTTATRTAGGYVINGQKTFITNGLLNDLVIVVARTSPGERHGGISLLLVEDGAPGYEKGRKLDKMGMAAQDTAELFFRDCRVPAENLLGEEGQGFYYLMNQLPRERLSIACLAIAGAETALDMTVAYCKERNAFGKPIGAFQHNRFTLAEMKTEIEIGRTFLNRCVQLENAGRLTPETAAMVKWWSTEMQKRVVDRCVQLHGGYGYMMEYPICRAYIDTRAQTIYAGSTEIMKEIIGKSMGL